MVQKPLSMIQNTLFVNLMTQNTLFTAMVEKIITYAHGEHYPGGSAQDGRTSNEKSSPRPECYDEKNCNSSIIDVNIF